MSIFAYIALVFFVVALAAVFDWAWLRYIRPTLARSYGWPDVRDDERIPNVVWICAAICCVVFVILLPWTGAAAGY